jgi:hypothetical protein
VPDRRPGRRIVLAALAAAITAAAAGCGAHPAAAAHHATAGAPSPSCAQQYAAWKRGGALAPGKRLAAALQAAQSASASEDIPATLAALKTAGSAAAGLGRYPMPACADPGGYWSAILARIRAAGDNAGTASGLAALLLAEAPLQAVPGLQAELAAELQRTT